MSPNWREAEQGLFTTLTVSSATGEAKLVLVLQLLSESLQVLELEMTMGCFYWFSNETANNPVMRNEHINLQKIYVN